MTLHKLKLGMLLLLLVMAPFANASDGVLTPGGQNTANQATPEVGEHLPLA